MKSVQIPDEVYQQAAQLAEAGNLSVETFLAVLVNERAGEWSRLQARAARGTLEKLRRVLAKVKDVPPDTADCF